MQTHPSSGPIYGQQSSSTAERHLKRTSRHDQPKCFVELRSDFQVNSSFQQQTTNPSSFVENLRHPAWTIKPSPASRHITAQKPFSFKDLRNCSHVFKRVDAIRKPLEHPYKGSQKVIRLFNSRTFIIEMNSQSCIYSTDTLKHSSSRQSSRH